MNNIFYTYAYLRKDDRTPYYIGKGCGKRAYDSSHNVKVPDDKDRIIFLKQNLTEEEAFNHEKYMIAVLGRKDLGTGILRNMSDGGEGHSNPSPEARRKNAESSRLQYQMGVGIGGLTEEQEKKRKENAIKGKAEWNKLHPEYNGGSLGRTPEQHSADSAKAIESGCAKYWKSMTKEERYEKRLKQGKKAGKKVVELGLGIHAWSYEERSKNAKKKFEDPNVVEKYRQQQREHHKNGTGAFAPGVREKLVATRYKNAKGFREFCVKSPEGKIYKGKGAKPFAREHGLPTTSFNNLLRGRIDILRGWTRVEETEQNSTVDLMNFFE